MSKQKVILGYVSDWEAHCFEYFGLTLRPTGPWTGYRYYIKCIGNETEREEFKGWVEDNIPDDFSTNESATRRSPRANWYFNSDDFALLVKLTWQTEED